MSIDTEQPFGYATAGTRIAGRKRISRHHVAKQIEWLEKRAYELTEYRRMAGADSHYWHQIEAMESRRERLLAELRRYVYA